MMKESDLACVPLILSQSNSTFVFVYVSIQIPTFNVRFGRHFPLPLSQILFNYIQFGATTFSNAKAFSSISPGFTCPCAFFSGLAASDQNNEDEWNPGLLPTALELTRNTSGRRQHLIYSG